VPKPDGFQGVVWPLIFPMLVKPAIQKNLNQFKAVVEKQSQAAARAPGLAVRVAGRSRLGQPSFSMAVEGSWDHGAGPLG
jgi:hypothetical protein